jgi:hypothetical protein
MTRMVSDEVKNEIDRLSMSQRRGYDNLVSHYEQHGSIPSDTVSLVAITGLRHTWSKGSGARLRAMLMPHPSIPGVLIPRE